MFYDSNGFKINQSATDYYGFQIGFLWDRYQRTQNHYAKENMNDFIQKASERYSVLIRILTNLYTSESTWIKDKEGLMYYLLEYSYKYDYISDKFYKKFKKKLEKGRK